MNLHDLIGFTFVGTNGDDIITVEKDGKSYELEICIDEGDCCGWADFNTTFYIKGNERPGIVDITLEDDNPDCEEDRVKVTFFGLHKKIAEINAVASSGSGWCYGACVTITCKALALEENIAEW
jgi:hypothetical protein